MKKISFLLLIAFACNTAKSQTLDDSRDTLNGVWWYTGLFVNRDSLNSMAANEKFIKGVFVGLNWSRLEQTRGIFDWVFLDSNLTAYANKGYYINLIVWTGPGAPSWLYAANTPNKIHSFKTDDTYKPDWVYPDYKDPNYIAYWYKMIDSVINHINVMPASLKDKIYIYQSAEGTTGDATAYKGTPLNPQYALTDSAWESIRKNSWVYTEQALHTRHNLTKAHLMINLGEDKPENYAAFLKVNLPAVWYKSEPSGHSYQTNGEPDDKKRFDSLTNIVFSSCNKTMARLRSEQNINDPLIGAWFKQDSIWNYYWINVYATYFGVDFLMDFTEDLKSTVYHPGMEFFAKYGGFKDSTCSPAAFCAFHDGLDAMDTIRFSNAIYGKGKSLLNDSAGIARCKNIAAAFADRGAKQEDPPSAQGGDFKQWLASKMNDVGWNIFAGNYEKYITQIRPLETSIGHWRVGPHDEPYGRFARGFYHAEKKDTMFFNVNNALFSSYPLNGKEKLQVTITFLDAGTGTWQLKYDAISQKAKTALTVNKTNTGKWQKVQVTLTDAFFGNRGAYGSDLMLVNNDDNDDIFHLIEINKAALF